MGSGRHLRRAEAAAKRLSESGKNDPSPYFLGTYLPPQSQNSEISESKKKEQKK